MRLAATTVSAGHHQGPGWIDLLVRLKGENGDDHEVLAEMLQQGARAKVVRCSLGIDGLGLALRIDPGPEDGGAAEEAAKCRRLESMMRG